MNTSLYAADTEVPPSSDEVATGLTVVMDCVSASLVTECTDSGIALPCSNVSMDIESRLPIRISYFLADPFEYMKALEPKDSGTGFFSALWSLLNSATENPLTSAVYIAMATRDYSPSKYLLSGYISFDYPDGVTLDDVLAIWSSRVDTDESIIMTVDMQLYGEAILRPLYVTGEFGMSVNADGDIVIDPIGTYNINNYTYQGGQFRM
ncbi:MAG: hypothetical protein IJ863_06370 [Spirochaetales bacterium]|nr:hypothetical protein [Spirochaetales bacterium]